LSSVSKVRSTDPAALLMRTWQPGSGAPLSLATVPPKVAWGRERRILPKSRDFPVAKVTTVSGGP